LLLPAELALLRALRRVLPRAGGLRLEPALCHLLRGQPGRHPPPARAPHLPGAHPQLLPPGEPGGILGAFRGLPGEVLLLLWILWIWIWEL
ncbi:hypothetical protein HGM15179_020580, partial [Zosterops borbonicus]